ncbi:MFS transporter [Nakamurella endophytica]|uniref:MFS transporter n=1 Tax=Nakamurella endophytica TaxID=1748367 RepID=A0A917WPE3_9ACTN|nr:MFS transporter [Nakamurella endophytica]GGM19054.1 MFS transporter [Nakamurella endophytica]
MTRAGVDDASRLPRPFRRLWLGESVSSFGTYVTLLGLQVVVLRTLGGDAQDVAWLSAVRWAPYLLLGLFAGVVVDRFRRLPVMVATDGACAALLALIPVLWWLGGLHVPALLAVVAAYSAVALFNDAASMSFLPRLVPRGDLQRAHARLDGSDAVAQASGPVLAGLLIKVVGAPVAILVDAASYLFSALMMASVRVAEPSPAAVPRTPIGTQIRDGVRWIYRGTSLRRLAVGTHLWFAGNAVLGVAVPVLALQTLQLTVIQFGFASAAAGVGALVGATLSTRAGRRWGTGGAVIAAHTVTTLGVLVMAGAAQGSGWAATAVLGSGQLLHGVAMGSSNSHEMSYRQAETPDGLQARTNITMRAANRAVVVLVAPVAGLLVAHAGPVVAILVAAAVFAVVVVVLAASPFRRARIGPSEEP